MKSCRVGALGPLVWYDRVKRIHLRESPLIRTGVQVTPNLAPIFLFGEDGRPYFCSSSVVWVMPRARTPRAGHVGPTAALAVLTSQLTVRTAAAAGLTAGFAGSPALGAEFGGLHRRGRAAGRHCSRVRFGDQRCECDESFCRTHPCQASGLKTRVAGLHRAAGAEHRRRPRC